MRLGGIARPEFPQQIIQVRPVNSRGYRGCSDPSAYSDQTLPFLRIMAMFAPAAHGEAIERVGAVACGAGIGRQTELLY